MKLMTLGLCWDEYNFEIPSLQNPVGILMEKFNTVTLHLVNSSPFTPIEFDRLITASNILHYWEVSVASWMHTIKDISTGLQFLYNVGVIHNHVRPDNIMVCTDIDGFLCGQLVNMSQAYMEKYACTLTQLQTYAILSTDAIYVDPDVLDRKHSPSKCSDVHASGQTVNRFICIQYYSQQRAKYHMHATMYKVLRYETYSSLETPSPNISNKIVVT